MYNLGEQREQRMFLSSVKLVLGAHQNRCISDGRRASPRQSTLHFGKRLQVRLTWRGNVVTHYVSRTTRN